MQEVCHSLECSLSTETSVTAVRFCDVEHMYTPPFDVSKGSKVKLRVMGKLRKSSLSVMVGPSSTTLASCSHTMRRLCASA